MYLVYTNSEQITSIMHFYELNFYEFHELFN